jgi:hypothetical protein
MRDAYKGYDKVNTAKELYFLPFNSHMVHAKY